MAGPFDDLPVAAKPTAQASDPFSDLPTVTPPKQAGSGAFDDLPDAVVGEVPTLDPEVAAYVAKPPRSLPPVQPLPVATPKYRFGLSPMGQVQEAPAPEQQDDPAEDVARAQATFEKNKPYVQPGATQFQTQLNAADENRFRQWVRANNIPFDPESPTPQDYDMRGYWQASQNPADWHDLQRNGVIPPDVQPGGTRVDPNDGKPHFPDYWKTPYHQTFSKESQFATDQAPAWNDKDQLVDNRGNVVFDDRQPGGKPQRVLPKGGATGASQEQGVTSPFLNQVTANVRKGNISAADAQQIMDAYNQAHQEGAKIDPRSVAGRAALDALNEITNGGDLQATIERYVIGGGADVGVLNGMKDRLATIQNILDKRAGIATVQTARQANPNESFAVEHSLESMRSPELLAMQRDLRAKIPGVQAKAGQKRANMLLNLAKIAGKWEGMPDPQGVAANIAAGVGHLAGQAPSPENAIGLEAAPARQAFKRLAGETIAQMAKRLGIDVTKAAAIDAATNAGVAAATDPIQQAAAINEGRQDAYDPLQSLSNIGAAAAFGAAGGAAFRGAGWAKDAWQAWRARSAEDIMRDFERGATPPGSGAPPPPPGGGAAGAAPPPPGGGTAGAAPGAGAGPAAGAGAAPPPPRPDYTKPEWATKFGNSATMQGDGTFKVDADGYVMSDAGGPMRFDTAKQAAQWIAEGPGKTSETQVFDLASHPGPMKPSASGRSATGYYTVKETMRRPKEEPKAEETATPGGEEAAAGTSSEGPKVNTGQEAPNPGAGGPQKFGPLGGVGPEEAQAGAEKPESGPAPGTKANPAEPETPEEMAAAAAHAAESDLNAREKPTEAQKAAGNYQKAHVKVQGLDISIENPKGSTRTGTSPDGTAWSNEQAAHYGYLKRTDGADDEHLDVFVGDNPKSDQVWVIDQVDPKTGAFDETKSMMGFDDAMSALEAYSKSYGADGETRIGAVTPMSIDDFKAWVKSPASKGQASKVEFAKPEEAQPAAEESPKPGVTFPDQWHSELYSYGRKLAAGEKPSLETRTRLWNAFKGYVENDPVGNAPFGGPADVDKLAMDYLGLVDETNHGHSVIDSDELPEWLKRQGHKGGPSEEQVNAAPEPEMEGVTAVPNSQLNIDPAKFQFKGGGDTEGVTETLRGVQKWEPHKADILTVYRDKAGKLFVADGHQRTGLARRLEANGHPPITQLARIYDAKDGYTPADVMVLAAVKNIAQGSGTPLDAAKVIRRLGLGDELVKNLPPRSALVRDGQDLAKLGDEAFQQAAQEVVPWNIAALVGREITGDKQQLAALDILRKADVSNVTEAQAILDQIKAQGFEDTIDQGGLFGEEQVSKSLVLERAKVLAAALTELKRNRALFNKLIKGADVAEAAGNKLDADANQQEKARYDAISTWIAKLANAKGEVSDALTAAAKAHQGGKRAAAAAQDFIAVVSRLPDGWARGAGPGEGASSAAEAPRGWSSAKIAALDNAVRGLLAKYAGAKPEGRSQPARGVHQAAPEPRDVGHDDAGGRGGSEDADIAASAARGPRKGGDVGPLLPGFEPSTKEQLAAKGAQKKPEQKPMDFGLFDTHGHLQTDIEANKGAEVTPPWTPQKRPLQGTPGAFQTGDEDFLHLLASMGGREGDPKAMTEAARKWVTERGKAHNVEHMVVVSDSGELLGAGTQNQPAQIGMNPKMAAAANTGLAGALTIHHNHPSNGSLSAPDIGMLMTKGVRRVVAYGHDGKTMYAAERGPEFPKLFNEPNPVASLQFFYDAVWHGALDVIKKKYPELHPTAEDPAGKELDLHFWHAIPIVLERLGLIDYVHSGAELDRIHPKSEKIADDVIKALDPKALERAFGPDRANRALSDRPAQPVREQEGMGRLSQRPGDSAPGRSFGRVRPAPGEQDLKRDNVSRSPSEVEAPAYHGSPHPKFDKFTTAKIGTGEGNQTFGWGMYFAGSKKVAQHYRDKLSSGGLSDAFRQNVRDTWEEAGQDSDEFLRLMNDDSSVTPAEKTFLNALAKDDWLGFDRPGQGIRAALGLDSGDWEMSPELQAAAKALKTGALYHVDLKPEEHEYLDLDKSFKNQSPLVQAALKKVFAAVPALEDHTIEPTDSGHRLYNMLNYAHEKIAGGRSDQLASEALHAAGIRGNRFLDQNSRKAASHVRDMERMAEDPQRSAPEREFYKSKADELKKVPLTSNYVIFHDDDVEIKAAEAPRRPYFTGGPGVPPRAAQQVNQGNLNFLQHINRPGFQGRLERYQHTFQRMVADDLIRGKQAQDFIEEHTGVPIPDQENFYLHAQAAVGIKAERVQQGMIRFVDPIFRAIRRSDHDAHWFEKGLYALHAPERNRRIAAINTAMPDGGSGVDTATANAYIAGLSTADRAELDNMARLVARLRREDLSNRVNAGLMDGQHAMDLMRTMPNYVPLQGREDLEGDEDAVMPGQGFSVRGQEFKQALGRWTDPTHILAHMISQYQTGIMRAENNRVGQSLANLVQAHPDPDFWNVDRVKFNRAPHPATGLVRTVYSADVDPDHTIYFKVNGQPHRIWIADKKFVAAMKNQRSQDILRALRWVGAPLHLWRMLTIPWNPEFLVGNMSRDIQDGLIQGTAMGGKQIAWRTVKNYLPSVQAAFLGAHGMDNTWTRWMRRAAAAGALSGNFEPIDISHWTKNVDWETATGVKGMGRRGARALMLPFHEIERFNTAIEAGMRVAVFRAAIEAGYSELHAANIAKNATVNFDRKGTLGPYWSPLYAFFQAAINGNYGLLRIIKRSPKFMAAVGGALFMMGAGEALMWKWLKENGTEDQKAQAEAYEMAPQWVTERNMMVPFVKPKDAPWLQQPLGWALAMPYGFGRQAMMRALGTISSGEMFSRMFHQALTWALPVDPTNGASGLAPTILRPGIEVENNQAWTGRPIYPDKHGKAIPDSQNYYDSVGPIWKEIAQNLNSWTGGDEVKPGWIDWSPNSMQYLWDQYVSGAGAFVDRLKTDYDKVNNGEELDWSEIPIARRFLGHTTASAFRDQFYTVYDQLKTLDDQRDQYEKKVGDARVGPERDGAKANQKVFKDQNAEALKFYDQTFKDAKNRIDDARDKIKDIDKSKTLSEEEKRTRRKAQTDKILGIAKAAIEKYNSQVLAPQQKQRALLRVTPSGIALGGQ